MWLNVLVSPGSAYKYYLRRGPLTASQISIAQVTPPTRPLRLVVRTLALLRLRRPPQHDAVLALSESAAHLTASRHHPERGAASQPSRLR